MWDLVLPIHEIVIRAVVIYVVLFVLFRLLGKKQIGEMSPFDIIVLLIISESVSAALSAKDDSIPAGLISAATLLITCAAFDRLAYHSKKMEKVLEGESQILIRDGKVDEKLRAREKITIDEILESLREIKIESIEDVRIGILETNGRITAFKRSENKQ